MMKLFGSFRPFAVSLVCTTALIGAAPWIPNSDVGAILAIASIFVGLPVSILLYRDSLLAGQRSSPGNAAKRAVLVFPVRLLGGVSFLSGVAIATWVACNVFIERQPQFSGLKSYSQLALPVMLILFGWSWLWRPLGRSDDAGDAR